MAKEKHQSEWDNVALQVRAIRELGIATARELAESIGTPEQRLYEWTNGRREPRAGMALKIQACVKRIEAKILAEGKMPAYKKVLKRLANEA